MKEKLELVLGGIGLIVLFFGAMVLLMSVYIIFCLLYMGFFSKILGLPNIPSFIISAILGYISAGYSMYKIMYFNRLRKMSLKEKKLNDLLIKIYGKFAILVGEYYIDKENGHYSLMHTTDCYYDTGNETLYRGNYAQMRSHLFIKT